MSLIELFEVELDNGSYLLYLADEALYQSRLPLELYNFCHSLVPKR